MIDVKQATGIAMVYLMDLLKGASDVTLEEVELSDDDKFWYITLSALVPAQVQPTSVLQSQTDLPPGTKHDSAL